MKFSLVLATVERTKEVERFLKSLETQTYRNFELIVVDQNPDDRLVPILRPYQEKFPIIHLQRVPRGLSRARNVGLKHISGDIIAFPDDNCWYPPTLLEEVMKFLHGDPTIDVAVFSKFPENMLSKFIWKINKKKARRVSFLSLPRSIDLFVKKNVVESIGLFDEQLGLGSGTLWIGCEEMDYCIRILKRGFKMVRKIGIAAIDESDEKDLYVDNNKIFGYGLSAGYVWRKHRLPLWLGILRLSVATLRMMENLLRGRLKQAYQNWAWMKGFIKGLMGKDG